MFDVNKLQPILEQYNVKCPICGQRNFTANQNPQSMSDLDLTTNSIKMGTGYAVAVVSCNTCGHILLFNASSLQ